MSAVYTAIRQNSAAYSPLFDKCQRYTPRYSTRSTCTAIYIQRVLAYTFSRHVSPTNLRFSFGSCRFRCIIFVLLLTCLAAFALTLLVCLFACRRKRNDRTRRGPMQRGATLPLPSRWPSTRGCNNTCNQPHWAPAFFGCTASFVVVRMRSSTFGPTPSIAVAIRKISVFFINATGFRIAIGIWKGHTPRARPT